MSKPRIEVSDTHRLTRKSLRAPTKDRKAEVVKERKAMLKGKAQKYPAGSLLAYAKDYRKAGFMKEQAECLAQIAYGQKQIRKRLESLEAIALAQVLGAVEISGEVHQISCAKRDDKTNECDCGRAAAKEG